jgi:hypothetical protein
MTVGLFYAAGSGVECDWWLLVDRALPVHADFETSWCDSQICAKQMEISRRAFASANGEII